MPSNHTGQAGAVSAQWPLSYGFTLYGEGPCYVLSVQRGSVAHRAGIAPGDQLLEVDGHNVADMSADGVVTLGRHCRTVPPTVGVVSRVQHVELLASRRWGFGLSLRGVRPTLVESVDPPGPAYLAGIRPGDVVLEVNGRKVRQLELLAPLLSTRYGKVTITVIPIETKHAPRSAAKDKPSSGDTSRVRKARDLFAKMNRILGSDYERKMAVVGLLKQYADDRNIEQFGRSLSLLLNDPQHRWLINDIRPFVPVKHRPQFDALLARESEGATSGKLTTFRGSPTGTARFTSIATGAPEHTKELYGEHTAIREVQIHRGSQGSFGFILRGHEPVYVESVTPGSPADRAGLRPGDAILKLNGLDVRRSSHGHVVKLLQGSGSSPRIQVKHLYDEEGLPLYSPGSQSSDESSASSHASSSGWLGDEGYITDENGGTFREKVDQLLTTKEKSSLRKALTNYNMHRNVAQLVDDLTTILDAPSKKTIWGFLLPRMPSDHREYVLKYVDIPKTQLDLLGANPRAQTSSSHQTPKTPGPGEAANTNGHDNVQHMGSFRQQLDYLLMSRERSQLKRALQIYSEKRNIQHLLEDLSDILDTPSKRTLWFYIIPLLSPSHQIYCQRRLGLPEHVIKSGTPGKGKATANNEREMVTPPSADAARISATPRRGDILYQQEDLVEQAAAVLSRDFEDISDDETDAGDMAGSRKKWPDQRSKGLSVDRSTIASSVHADSGYLSRDGEQSTVTLNPDYVDAIGRRRGPHVQRVRESSSQTTPHASLRQAALRDYRTVVHVYNNAHGRADILELQQPTYSQELPKPATGLPQPTVADVPPLGFSPNTESGWDDPPGNQTIRPGQLSMAATAIRSPATDFPEGGDTHYDLLLPHTESSIRNSLASIGTENHQAELTKNSDHAGDMFKHSQSPPLPPSSVANGGDQAVSVADRWNGYFQPGSDPVAPPAGLDARQHADAGPIIHYEAPPAKSSSRQQQSGAPSVPNGYANGGALSDAESETSSAMKTSVTSFDSFQTKAMKAIRALDDVVANEPSELDFAAILETPSLGPQAPPMPPPPPPPPPVPPPLPAISEPGSGSKQMHVKRMNWEKIDNVHDNMIWSKIGDGDELADVVKYLELETQFSTRRNKISESFRDRKNETCILNSKKAYNLSILLGHLKRGVATVKRALFQMDEELLAPELLRQMLAYAPDEQEMQKYESFKGASSELSKADQFMYQLTRIPGYLDRLRSMVFKANFSEKVTEVQKQLFCIKTASDELQSSQKLAKILELVLAMGNYMNKGHQRVGQAAGFRISFLSQLELTKTSDNRATFLHVLADAVATRFPEALNLQAELPTVREAARVSNDGIANEIRELKEVLKNISEAADRLKTQSKSAVENDRFEEIITQFTTQASEEIEQLTRDQEESLKIFKAMVTYFGEDPSTVDAGEFFNTFANFITKFERAHQHNVLHKRHYLKDGTTAARSST